jgi:hypothetical protein
MLPGVSESDVVRLISELPHGAEGSFDRELWTLVVEVDSTVDVNDVHRVLSESRRVAGTVLDDRAVPRYLPDRAALPAEWDGFGAEWDICTSCGWVTATFATVLELEAERRRHETVAHPHRR